MQFPQIDRSLTLRQLQLLGHSENENVYLRFFYPSDDPRKAEDKGRKSDRLNFEEIEAYQRQGRGAYFVVNGGGHKNENVLSGRAIFYEHDDLDKEQQKTLWQILELPEPTFQVDTGGKSIHSYWVFDRPIPVPEWCELQRDLLEMSNGDRSIKNPARVMRLAGAWHISIDREGKPVYNQSRIISESGKNYSYEDLRTAVTVSEPEASLPLGPESTVYISREPGVNVPHYAPRHPDQIQIPVPEAVPLEICLAKESRKIFAGFGKGERNTGGAKLVRDLIGTYNYLIAIGQSVDGDPRQLLEDYARNCNPPLPKSEIESIWQSGLRDNPSPSCGSEGVNNCIKGWYWKTNLKYNLSNTKKIELNKSKKVSVTGDSRVEGDSYNPDGMDVSTTVTTVTAILQKGLKDYEERMELDRIQFLSKMSKGSFWSLVTALKCQLDEVTVEDSQKLDRLIDWHGSFLDFNKILPPQLASVFTHDAEVLNIDPVSLWQYFLPTVLSLSGKRLNLDAESHLVPSIIWTCLVSESGTGKSRAEGVILAPLKKRQHEERKRFLSELKDYKQLLKTTGKDDPEPEPPRSERKYLFEVATIQAVMRRLAEQGVNGSLWARDEIAGLFKSLGQFGKRKDENEGLECLLKMWDGAGAVVDRVRIDEDSYLVEETRLSIAGGIQPGAFRQAFKDPADAQGLQARFLYAIPKVLPAKRVKGYCELSELLPSLYDWLDRLPSGTIKLSACADRRYTNLVEQIGVQAEGSETPTLRAWERKLPTQLLRIALALHLVECYYQPRKNLWVLEKDTLERAVEVGRYYRSAFAVIQEKVAETDSISSMLLQIWDKAVTTPSGVTPRDIYRGIKAIPRRANELGRTVAAYTLELLSSLVKMGKGVLRQQGRQYRFFATVSSVEEGSGDSVWGVGETGRRGDGEMGIFTQSPSPLVTQSLHPTPAPLHPNLAAVTVVTEAQSHTPQEKEVSPKEALSLVTVDVLSTEVKSAGAISPDLKTCCEETGWLIQFLADLERSQKPHPRFRSQEQVMAEFEVAEEKYLLVTSEIEQYCPDYAVRMATAIGEVIELLPYENEVIREEQEKLEDVYTNHTSLQPTTHNPQPSSPTLAELQGLLLACKTLASLKELKKKYSDRVGEAYQKLSQQEQLIVDAVSATAVPYQVFKYVGESQTEDDHSLRRGSLVYIDPNEGKANKHHVGVWLLRGIELGWRKAVTVSRDLLLEIEKVASDALNGAVQPPLFEA
jgi:hypothetical protein